MAENTGPMLRLLTDGEAKEILGAFETFKAFHGIALNARPFIELDGTIGCEARFYKVESPKAEGETSAPTQEDSGEKEPAKQ